MEGKVFISQQDSPWFSGVFLLQKLLVSLSIYDNSIKYGSNILQFHPTTNYSLIFTTSNDFQLSFYFSAPLIFKAENWTKQNTLIFQSVLAKLMTKRIQDLKDLFKPTKKINSLTFNYGYYYLGERNQDKLNVTIKAISKKGYAQCDHTDGEIERQIYNLKKGKYKLVEHIGVYETANTIYMIYRGHSISQIPTLDQINPQNTSISIR